MTRSCSPDPPGKKDALVSAQSSPSRDGKRRRLGETLRQLHARAWAERKQQAPFRALWIGSEGVLGTRLSPHVLSCELQPFEGPWRDDCTAALGGKSILGGLCPPPLQRHLFADLAAAAAETGVSPARDLLEQKPQHVVLALRQPSNPGARPREVRGLQGHGAIQVLHGDVTPVRFPK